VVIEYGLLPEGIRPVAITVRAGKGTGSVNATMLRALKVSELAQAGIINGILRTRHEEAPEGETHITLLPPLDPRDRELARLRGPIRSSLEVAATVYNIAQIAGLPPVQQLMTELGLPRATASAWVKRCKELGLITSPEGEHDGEH
jgi:hypothetical protein